MVLGITVDGPEQAPDEPPAAPARAPRKLTLLMQREANRFGNAPAYGFVLFAGCHRQR